MHDVAAIFGYLVGMALGWVWLWGPLLALFIWYKVRQRQKRAALRNPGGAR